MVWSCWAGDFLCVHVGACVRGRSCHWTGWQQTKISLSPDFQVNMKKDYQKKQIDKSSSSARATITLNAHQRKCVQGVLKEQWVNTNTQHLILTLLGLVAFFFFLDHYMYTSCHCGATLHHTNHRWWKIMASEVQNTNRNMSKLLIFTEYQELRLCQSDSNLIFSKKKFLNLTSI